jgi:hypothetical protein
MSVRASKQLITSAFTVSSESLTQPSNQLSVRGVEQLSHTTVERDRIGAIDQPHSDGLTSKRHTTDETSQVHAPITMSVA